MSDAEEPWETNPLRADRLEGFVHEAETVYIMQTRLPDGTWEPLNSPRKDRDEVTRLQAFYLNKDVNDHSVRVLKRTVIWTVDEVPGYGYGKTAPEEILTRNEEITKRLLQQEDKQTDAEHH